MVDAYLLGVALGLIFPARDGKVADSLLLFCIDRDDRLAGFLKRLHLFIDGVKLRVTIRMGTAFLGLAGPLHAVSEIGQQVRHRAMTAGVALASQRLCQLACTLACPPER